MDCPWRYLRRHIRFRILCAVSTYFDKQDDVLGYHLPCHRNYTHDWIHGIDGSDNFQRTVDDWP